MSDAERLEQLERRMAQLEEQMRVLTGQRGSEAARQPSTPALAAPPPRGPTAQPATAPPPRRPAAPLLSSEQWIGQRVLLAVGVVALILAAGYLLRLSFDRGWISPVMRCIGGAGAGLIVGALGWRLHPRYRTYGAALIG